MVQFRVQRAHRVCLCAVCVCTEQCAVCTITFMIKMCLMFISFTLLFSGKRYHKCIPRAIVKQQFRRKKKRRKKNGSTRFILGYFFLPFLSSTESSWKNCATRRTIHLKNESPIKAMCDVFISMIDCMTSLANSRTSESRVFWTIYKNIVRSLFFWMKSSACCMCDKSSLHYFLWPEISFVHLCHTRTHKHPYFVFLRYETHRDQYVKLKFSFGACAHRQLRTPVQRSHPYTHKPSSVNAHTNAEVRIHIHTHNGTGAANNAIETSEREKKLVMCLRSKRWTRLFVFLSNVVHTVAYLRIKAHRPYWCMERVAFATLSCVVVLL